MQGGLCMLPYTEGCVCCAFSVFVLAGGYIVGKF